MPEVKNTFIQSKMNKDMDGRILPNGQYRDGQNIQISRSEGDDVGALETVLGNDYKTNFNLTEDNLVAIGKLVDDSNDRMYLFLTDYTDCSYNQLENNCAGAPGVNCYIVVYNNKTELGSILVEGSFLNFSTTHLITGVNLIENLLFWTDNRNQPRKININSAITGYYTTEDQISVAKYYPYESPLLLNVLNPGHFPGNTPFESSMTDQVSEYLPIHTAAKIKYLDAVNSPFPITLYGCYDNIKPNTTGSPAEDGNLVTGVNVNNSPVLLNSVSVDYANDQTVIELVIPGNPSALQGLVDNLAPHDILYFQFQNPDYNVNWPGDPNYFKDKFARFSYRFKFDDGEYSLMAPFTQIAFVPEQDGYFIGDKANGVDDESLVGQESATFDTTEVSFMQNKINNVNICMLSPTEGNSLTYMNWEEVEEKLKITEVEILYKLADSNKISILDTLTSADFGANATEYLYYDYQSRKPWRTVVPNQTTRVNELVPVRALAQEVSGNRVIYGNFIDKHSSPLSLNYTLQIGDKPEIPEYAPAPTPNNWLDTTSYVRKEYQNHTLKQNRTYQVGVVLSDRYGRQSNVILSSVQLDNSDPDAKGSTIFHTYKNIEDQIIEDKYQVKYTIQQDPTTWPGDMLRISFDSVIPKGKSTDGYPGIYSIDDGSLVGVELNEALTTDFSAYPATWNVCTYSNIPIIGADGGTASITFNIIDNGEIEVIIVDAGSGWTYGQKWTADFSMILCTAPCNIGGPVTCPEIHGNGLTPEDNPLGWYSYKIVVKQQEQEYYNVYLPGSMAGYPCWQNQDSKPPLTFNTIQGLWKPDDETDESAEYTLDPTKNSETISEYGTVPRLVYPEGQWRHTSHIVLFSDNINKVPRDLEEVGPVQNEFRSSQDLYFRVESFLLSVTANDTYSSHQYKPNPLGDKVITVASMEKLKLGDLSAVPEYPIFPNLFYKGETNPLVGRVEVEEQFGIWKLESHNECEDAFVAKDNLDGTPLDIAIPRNTKYGYGPTLAVAETKPVESLLDIFWETSTSGLISDLNYSIEFEDNTAPSGLSDVDITWSEADNYGTIISNDFQAVGPTGNPLGAGVLIEKHYIEDGAGTQQTGRFDLNQVAPGEYNISLSDCNLGGCPGWICSGDSSLNVFYFTFKLTDLGTGLITYTTSTGYIFNRAPNDRGGKTVAGLQFTNNLRDWIKDSVCDPVNNLGYDNGISANNPRDAQTISLRSEEGGQKFGLSLNTWSVGGTPGYSRVYLDQFLASEDSIPNGAVNFGIIKNSRTKPVYWDRQLDPAYASSVSPFDSPEDECDCGGNVKDASPDNRGGGASGFRSFGYFGLRNFYNLNQADPVAGTYLGWQPTGQKPWGWPNDSTGLMNMESPYDGNPGMAIDNGIFCNSTTGDAWGCQMQYLYDIDQWDEGTTNSVAVPEFQNVPYPNIHDEDPVAAPIYMGYKEGTKCNTVTIHPSCKLRKLTGADDWDGIFLTTNGVYGSHQPAEIAPISGGAAAGTHGEIRWSIPRMYQVSMMVPFGETQREGYAANSGLMAHDIDDPTSPGRMGNYGASALAPNPEWYMDYQPAGEVIFGLYQSMVGEPPLAEKPTIWTDPTDDFIPPVYNRNSILRYMPSGPIYWHNNEDQLIAGNAGEGEAIVGQRYNSRTDVDFPAGDEYPHHYWPDLNAILTRANGVSDCIKNFRDDPTGNPPPDFMKLQNGANTFYQWNKEFATWSNYKGEFNNVAGNNAREGSPSDSKDYLAGWWSIDKTKEKNILDYMFWIGGIDSNLLGNPNNLQRFFAKALNNNTGLNQTARGFITAGSENDPKQPWVGPSDYGNGMPGGRYVVTLRATDKTGNADGLYYEWDVPIFLPWWATRTNCPLLCEK